MLNMLADATNGQFVAGIVAALTVGAAVVKLGSKNRRKATTGNGRPATREVNPGAPKGFCQKHVQHIQEVTRAQTRIDGLEKSIDQRLEDGFKGVHGRIGDGFDALRGEIRGVDARVGELRDDMTRRLERIEGQIGKR